MQAIGTWFGEHPGVEIAAGVIVLALVAWLGDVVARRFLLSTLERVARRTRATWDDRIIERRVFARVANIVPALVIFVGIGPVLGVIPGTQPAFAGVGVAVVVVRRVAASVMVLLGAVSISAFLSAVDDIYRDTYEDARRRPIKGYLQVVKIVVFVAAGVVMLSLLADRNPAIFLSGLGALTAVLMLVFRDTILSLVASLQIMSNDMIRIGDWIEMPQANTDGDVVDIALHTVRIQNWDKTISAIPTHRFISESFKNWRGMSDSGGRRIKRAIHIDMNSVHFLSEEEVERLSRYETLEPYMRSKREELAESNERETSPGVIPERRRLTNLGTFRAYLIGYLRKHPRIHEGMTLLVRQLAPGPQGVPIEVYCFSNDTEWANYEGIQADIFDHLIAILPEFGLVPFQLPAGRDVQGWAGEGLASGRDAGGADTPQAPGTSGLDEAAR